jgi:hypothetical protein
MQWTGYVSSMGEIRNSSIVFLREAEGKRLFKRFRHGWKHNIKCIIRN